ncbi:Crp/Fnr family transcriptional regulator [Rhodococcus sp. NPDC056960]|uniref:Crp/Fnr family transcriptional regulator n=1 Tax=Rhodococcus TaxID=1827 RepID=UPI00362E3BF8
MESSRSSQPNLSGRRILLEAAWEASRFGELSESVKQELLATATVTSLAKDEMIRWDVPILMVIATGRVGIYVSSTERLAMMRHLGPGEMTGLASAFRPTLSPARLPLIIKAATPAQIMKLSPQRLATVAQRDGAIAWRIGQWLVDDMVAGHMLLADEIFLSVKQLLARTLLDLAVQEGGRWLVYETQQNLADAIGSVRAVTGRALSELRDAGLLVREGRALRILDRDGLRASIPDD